MGYSSAAFAFPRQVSFVVDSTDKRCVLFTWGNQTPALNRFNHSPN